MGVGTGASDGSSVEIWFVSHAGADRAWWHAPFSDPGPALELERGLLHGRICYEGDVAVLDLDHAPAPRLLGDAALASAYNTAYERVYPGALTELGIPATALTGREAWEQRRYS